MCNKHKSWKPEVKVAGEGDKFYSNALRFATEQEALANAENLFQRWLLCEDFRAMPSDDPVNYRWVNGELIHVEEKHNE